jgi:hypothetical protein
MKTPLNNWNVDVDRFSTRTDAGAGKIEYLVSLNRDIDGLRIPACAFDLRPLQNHVNLSKEANGPTTREYIWSRFLVANSIDWILTIHSEPKISPMKELYIQ